MKKFDIISIGDTVFDVFLELEDAKIQCDQNQENCLICISWADKVAVKKVTKVPAVGNSANVAVGCSRLGLKSAFYTILGNDSIGKESFERLKLEGVYKDYIKFDKKGATNYHTVLNFKGERTILIFHEHRDYNLPVLAKSDWIYLSSLGPDHQKLHQQVVDHVSKTGAKLGFNPGTYQLKDGLEGLKPLIKKTAVFFVNKEEAERLLGHNEDVKELLRLLHNEGAKIVAMTDGKNGSYSFDGNNFYYQHVLKVPIIEMTGCGDSYSAGFISALQSGYDISEAMKWGTVNAASVLQKIGAQEGLLYRKQMEDFIKGNTKLDFIKDNYQLRVEKI